MENSVVNFLLSLIIMKLHCTEDSCNLNGCCYSFVMEERHHHYRRQEQKHHCKDFQDRKKWPQLNGYCGFVSFASSKLLLEGKIEAGVGMKEKNKQEGTFAHVFAPQVGVPYYYYYYYYTAWY